MYIISLAKCTDGLSIGYQYIRYEWDAAVACAIAMAQRNGAEESEADLREEIENDGDYVSPDGEWGVFIGQPEEGDPPAPKAKKQRRG